METWFNVVHFKPLLISIGSPTKGSFRHLSFGMLSEQLHFLARKPLKLFSSWRIQLRKNSKQPVETLFITKR